MPEHKGGVLASREAAKRAAPSFTIRLRASVACIRVLSLTGCAIEPELCVLFTMRRPIGTPKALLQFLAPAFLLCAQSAFHAAWAQCGPVIGTFPYSEGFEASAAWTSGGTASDWAWGTPAHPFINSAGGGTKSWCVGGLTGTFYNNNERSYLESPCFDFSSLNRPRISFKIHWEVERQYDGMTFQYSTDGGATYSNVGAYNEPADCNTANWFNSGNLTNLPSTISPKHGWSGRQEPTQGLCLGGNGSQGWVTAKHCLGWLANAPSVRFRFFFGAGSTCNNYDGIAVDDILIDESDPVVASFSGDCTGNTIDFANTSTPCPDIFSWNFGDPGQQNTSTLENPSHTYATPGSYTITLTATDACGASHTASQIINVLGVSTTATDPTCGQDNGSLEATVTGATGAVNYYWSPGGATTQTVSDIGPGTYTVTVSALNSCSATVNATLPPSVGDLALNITHTDVSCPGLNDGSATAVAIGGVVPLSYLWSPGGATAATVAALAPGDHTCMVTDASGCSAQAVVSIAEPAPLTLAAGPDTAVCAGSTITLVAQAGGGAPGYTYAWAPAGPTVSPTATTSYSVTATDAHGCTSAPEPVTVTVSAAFQPSFTYSDTVGCTPLCVTFQAQPAGAGTYQWSFGDGATGTENSVAHCFAEGGSYAVGLTVTDASGCTGTAMVPGLVHALTAPSASFTASPSPATLDDPVVRFINTTQNATEVVWSFGDAANSGSSERSPSFRFPAVDCYSVTMVASNDLDCQDSAKALICVEDPFMLFVPNAFTPDGDGINDVLLPLTSVRNPTDFRLMIFDRWGSPVFTTSDPYQGWDGSGLPDGLYVWKLWITDSQGIGHIEAGHVALLR